MDALDRKTLVSIDEYGWFALTVAPAVGDDDDGPVFTYSIGFETSLNQSNVIVIGLRSELMHSMLWKVFDGLKEGRTLSDRGRWDDILEGHTCEFRAVHSTNLGSNYFNHGRWYWQEHLQRTDPYSAFQLFWPGVNDRLLPWEDGADLSLKEAQPRLDLPATHLH